MKKNILVIISITVSAIVFVACNTATTKTSTPISEQDKVVRHDTLASDEIYTCKMHQDVMSDKPGKCSVCGMNLEKQKMTDQQKKLWKEGTYLKAE